MRELPTILIDSREKYPLRFPPGVVTQTIEMREGGDYTTPALRGFATWERKEEVEIRDCMSNKRAMFIEKPTSQAARLSQFKYAVIVVAGTFEHCFSECEREYALRRDHNPPLRGFHPNSFLATIKTLHERFGLQIEWAGDSHGVAQFVLEQICWCHLVGIPYDRG